MAGKKLLVMNINGLLLGMAGKKLLVMNINGLLMHRVHFRDVTRIPKSRSPDWVYGRYENFLVFKRPFCEEFMKFCLKRYEVGIWSYAKKKNIDDVLACAIGPLREKISFVLDQCQCTDSRYKSLEKASKPLFFKEFNKMWQNVNKGGTFYASNILLIDDKPYKAFLNPDNTAIFPQYYEANNVTDRALGKSFISK